jgi:hypothetical protein
MKSLNLSIKIFAISISSLIVNLFPHIAFSQQIPERILIIQIDSLHPEYLNLNNLATGPGSDGDWLMPNVKNFILSSTRWANAKAHFPQTTDANIFNILSSSNSGNTGIIGVRRQFERWSILGLIRDEIHLGKARYYNGDQVKTIFDITKENSPTTKTAIISNKSWIPEEYGSDFGIISSVDIRINGENYPSYISPPQYISFYDNPATDPDAYCDPESEDQTSLFAFFESRPYRHPRDSWVAETTIRVLEQENPGVSFILFGDLDHGQHLLGTASDPTEWKLGAPPILPSGCEQKAQYQWVNKRNDNLYKEPILDLVRDVDLAFGQLMDGLNQRGYLQNSVVILVSDHNMENYLYRPGSEEDTDITSILTEAGLAPKYNYAIYNGGSVGYLYWRPAYKLFNPLVVRKALAELLNEKHKLYNPETGIWEIPWDVMTRQDMLAGRPDLGIEAKEMYHDYFIKNGVWPDLTLVMKPGWQIHSYSIMDGEEELQLLKAGHGTYNTSAVLIAISGLDFPQATVCQNQAKLSDIAITLSEQFGWPFPEAIGTPLVCQAQEQ